ncbi:TKL protein kinase [Saprolegnia diclina VS20]|uniref:TKL protein kinase n=1 Tax=Saprolegnia diclina (strain VS20) TaxID=1156394 RepID=T0S6H4_SAPDV|nr:TKL protein kinase [Saprolegnia diclina VS20]EQC38357.1 TKL protein kinase [Saprolegnia diclina VS20]|eukprot:XP_008607949.1 TKL protein kinase [Saprolegnia diclina VS20]
MQSPYIVQLLGASWRIPSDLQMVLEWMDRGDLRSVLYKTAPSTPNEASASFSWDEKIECMLSIVEGLVYLHSMNILHRDLKSRNILLDSTKGTKLTDFGTSREMSTETMTIGVGTFRWMAPEVLHDCYYSTAADVYSFGVVLSELSTHEIPYYDLCNEKGQRLGDTAIMSRVMSGSTAPTFGTSTPSWVLDLGKACIATSPESRPTAIQIAHVIRQHIQTAL